LICEVCHAGQLLDYSRTVGSGSAAVTIKGKRCERCGHTLLENDEDIWSAVGL
jgi:hypothetical protein